MKLKSLRRFCGVAVACASLGVVTCLAAAENGRDAVARDGNAELNAVSQLWSDHPEYIAELRRQNSLTKPPRFVSNAPPIFPSQFQITQPVTVMVSFAIGVNGGVEEARVLQSSDSRFDQAALAAVLLWKFLPAENAGGPVRSIIQVPVVFQPPGSPGLRPIGMNFTPLTYQRGDQAHALSGSIQLTGAGSTDVKAGRVIITAAQDDTGKDLRQINQPSFYHPSVGRSSDAVLSGVETPWLNFSLSTPASEARTIAVLEGVVELVIPAADPAATARFEALPQKIAAPLISPLFRQAGVTVVLFDKATCDRYRAAGPGGAAGGPADYDVGPFFGAQPPGVPDAVFRKFAMEESDWAIGIDDPQGRLINLEFETVEGGPLIYNHNGQYHSGGFPGKRFAIYHFNAKLPDSAILVCWLITPQSLIKTPFKLANLPLPSPAP